MPDIKLKPAMDKPKVLEVNRAPKEAAALLKEQYAAQSSKRQPAQKDAVQYAVEQVETTARRGAVLAAEGARRRVKRHKENTRQKTGWQQTETVSAEDHVIQTNEIVHEEAQPLARQSHDSQRARQLHVARKHQQPVQGRETRHARPYDGERIQQVSSAAWEPPTIRERGRQKAIEDAKQKRLNTRRLTEKETIIAYRTRSVAEDNAQLPRAIKQKGAGLKSGSAGIKGTLLKTYARNPAAAAAGKAKQEAQKKRQRQMLQQSVVQTKKAAGETGGIVVRAAKGAARAAALAAQNLLVAGSGILLLVTILLIALIAIVAASPFGIFFSGERPGPDAVPVSAAVAEINSDFNAQLEALQAGGSYDSVVIHGAAADWPEVLAVFASKVAGAEGSEAADVVTIDRDRISKLKAVFWDMTAVSSYVEQIFHGDGDPNDGVDDSWTEYILHITITAKTAAEMPALYNFTPRQTSAMKELLAQRAMLVELIGSITIISADADAVLADLPKDLLPERRAVVKAACSLVGKVNYFWGGKSYVLGWDSRWGQLQKVWAEGSTTTGTYRPFGLDCSGFVDWVFYNASGGDYIIGHGGGAAMQRSYCTPISWSDAQPGDLVFYADDSHVGIVGGRDAQGDLLVIHCASGYNNVVVTGIEGFVCAGRPAYYR